MNRVEILKQEKDRLAVKQAKEKESLNRSLRQARDEEKKKKEQERFQKAQQDLMSENFSSIEKLNQKIEKFLTDTDIPGVSFEEWLSASAYLLDEVNDIKPRQNKVNEKEGGKEWKKP